jgi:signal transduction histidine kinase
MEAGGITGSRTIIFLFTGYVLTRLMSAQRAQRSKLAEANHQLVHYAATAEQLAVSRERNRLARELHDTVAHTLSALSVQLEAVDSAWDHAPEQARTILQKAQGGTRNGLTETRRALQALRASPLEDLGLVRALQELAESSAARASMQLEMSLPDELKNVAPDVEQTVYRIAQEALSNIVKHSNATRIRVLLRVADGRLTLEIGDNGRGFVADSEEVLGHFGLRGMRERTELIGGTLKIESKRGAGTRVRLDVSQL